MNRCPDARALLPEYVEGELSAAESARVAGHLRLCGSCSAEENRFRQAMGLLSAPRSVPEHGDLYAGFAAKLDRHENRFRLRPRQLRWAGSLACLLLVAGVGASVVQMGLLKGSDSHNSAPAPAPLPPATGPVVAKVEEDRHPDSSGRSNDASLGNQDNGVTPDTPVPNVVEPKEDITAVTPDPVVGRDQPSDRRRGRRGGAVLDTPGSFMIVKDQRGRTASDLLRERHNTVADTVAPKRTVPDITDPAPYAVNMPSAPNVSVMVPAKEERVRVGDRVTRVRRETGYDSEGELALIRIKAEPEKAGDKPVEKTGEKTSEKRSSGPTAKDADKSDGETHP